MLTLRYRELTRRRESGAVAVVVALLMVALVATVAIVIDLGMARDVRRQSQNGSDASALAAGNVLMQDQTKVKEAVAAAKTYASANFATTEADWSSCTDPARPAGLVAWTGAAGVPATACVSFDSLAKASKVRVKLPRRTVSTFFGGAVGRNTIDVGSEAEVAFKPGGKADCGLCIIGPADHDIQNGNVEIANGNVAFNGNAGSGPNGEVNVTTSGGTISIEGDRLFPSKGEFTPAPLTHQPKQEDPLGFMAMPPSTAGLAKKTNICTDGPGIYASFNPTTNPCVMAGGMYVITGGSHYSGQSQVVATGVTLYFTCKDGSGWPRVCGVGEGEDQSLTGQSTLSISAPTTTANRGIVGLSILADRNYAGMFSFRGNPVGGISGTIYMKSGTIDIRGNGETTTASSLIVVDDLTFSGNGATLNINYLAGPNVYIPPTRLHLTR